MHLSEVKKAMNMKCAMNKLCGGDDTAKTKRCEINVFSECRVFLKDEESDIRLLFDMFKEIMHHTLH